LIDNSKTYLCSLATGADKIVVVVADVILNSSEEGVEVVEFN
jgi:hypothetical protein